MPVMTTTTSTAEDAGAIPQNGFVGDDGSAVLALTWSKSDAGMTHSALTNPPNVIQSTTSGSSSDHSDWIGATEPVVLSAASIVKFQCRFQFDDALHPAFLFGVVDASASRSLVHYGAWVECATSSRLLVCRAVNNASSTSDYVSSNGRSVLDNSWHNLEIELRVGALGASGVCIYRLDGSPMTSVALSQMPTGQPLKLFRGFVAGTSGAKTLYTNVVQRAVLQ